MSKIDADLAAALKQAKTRPMYFAVVMKSPGEGTLIVSKTKVSPKAINEAKQDLGGGQIFQGRCAGEETGGLMFTTSKEPPATLNKTLKAVISRDAGLTLKVDVQQGAAAADDEDKESGQGSAPSIASKGPEPDKNGITKRLGGVVAEYTKLQSSPVARGPEGDSLKKQFDLVKSAIAKQDWPGASRILDEVDRLLARAKTGQILYQLGFQNGSAPLGEQSQKMRATLQKQAQYAELIHYYDEGFKAGQSASPPAPAYNPNPGPTMTTGHRLTEEEKQRDRDIDWAKEETRRIMGGQNDENPHIDPDPPKVPEPPVAE